MSSIRLSPEQEAILATAEPPASSSKLVRITAAAGTGKTTTLLYLAEKCVQLGHSHLTYITFNKSAAADGCARLQQMLSSRYPTIRVEARTLHSCAMMLLSQVRYEDYMGEKVETKLVHEEALKEEIQTRLQTEIQEFLGPCFREISRLSSQGSNSNPGERARHIQQSKESAAEKQVVFFLYKTLIQFCHSQDSLEMFADRTRWERDYYPAKKFHFGDKKALAYGFSPHIYRGKVSWYANQANRLWNMLGNIRNYDLEMKRAHLAKLEIPGTALLVDECQDMDACQVGWVSDQYDGHGSKLIFMVGDAAQTIYSFHGAKSKYMMELPHPVTDGTLTMSWRFGPPIAKIANVVLFCKEHCPQTTAPKKKTWTISNHRRITRAVPSDGRKT